jgi:ribonuclease-3
MNPLDEKVKVYNPWNVKNKEIQLNDIHHILRKFGWKGRVRSIALFQQATTHKSYIDRPDVNTEQAENGDTIIIAEKPDNCLPLRKADNEELEFLGDSILGAVIATYITIRYPGHGEGFLTRLRTRIVNNKMLGILSKHVGLQQWAVLSRHVEDMCNGRNNLRILGSLLEAWIGALYKQEEDVGRGFQVCYDWIVNVIERHVDFVQLITEDTNFKDQLLRYFQSAYHQPPRYAEVNIVGPPHARIFTMGVLSPDGKIIATATSRNKKIAEQEASRIALECLTNSGDGDADTDTDAYVDEAQLTA